MQEANTYSGKNTEIRLFMGQNNPLEGSHQGEQMMIKNSVTACYSLVFTVS